jgi:hypothetical protein
MIRMIQSKLIERLPRRWDGSSSPQRITASQRYGAAYLLAGGRRGHWEELADLIEESYRMTAPKRLVTELGA